MIETIGDVEYCQTGDLHNAGWCGWEHQTAKNMKRMTDDGWRLLHMHTVSLPGYGEAPRPSYAAYYWWVRAIEPASTTTGSGSTT